jgi:hypothetical protein
MLSTDMIAGAELHHGKYRIGPALAVTDPVIPQKNDNDSRTEALHSMKQVKVTIKREQQLIKDLELEAEHLDQSISSPEIGGNRSSKRAKLEAESGLDTLKREIGLRKFALTVARAAFVQFMLTGDNETIDLSNVVRVARDECLVETDSNTNVGEERLTEIIELMLAKLGLCIKKSDNWNLEVGFLIHQEISV